MTESKRAVAFIDTETALASECTDFFLLTEQDGAWRIRSKVFFAHSRA